MSPRTRSILAQVVSFLLAGILLYLALRGVDLRGIVRALEEAEYIWLIPLVAVALASHLARAWRWRVLIRALPEVRSGERSVPGTWPAFASLMIGYMVNYAAPRLGEVARTASLTAHTRISFGSLFGTVFVDRVLDVVVLGLGLISVAFLLADRFATLDALFLEPIANQLGSIPALALGLSAIAVVVLVFLIYRQLLRRSSGTTGTFWSDRAAPMLASFKGGILTVVKSEERLQLLGHTVLIWVLYLLMAYLPFVMLGMDDRFGLGLVDTWSILMLGSIGVAIPSPGGIGSYHYITIQTLVHLYGVETESAATYAVLTHAAQLVLYVIVGAICLTAQGSGIRALRSRTIHAQEKHGAS